ncbi:MAG: hypothetical protein ABII82_05510, partial [Verrucomicrobiota bacterium]
MAELIKGCRLICGDAREILPTLSSVGVVITDPPYSLNRREGEFAATGNIAVCLHEASKLTDTLLVFGTSSGRGIEFLRTSIKVLP